MIATHLLDDSPSLSSTYFESPTWDPRTPLPTREPRRHALIDWREDLDIVFGVVFTLLGVVSAVAALAVQL